MRFLTTLVWLSLAPALVSLAAEEKPKTDDRLKELLKRFPDADGNKDGVLTREEAQAYRQAIQSDRDKKKASPRKGQAEELLKPTHADVKYGPAERNVFDFYQAKSDKPTPLIINIHGGGFVAGDKRAGVNAVGLKFTLDAGISFASINYRFVDGKDTIFPAPQHDGARAVQFLRSKAKEWNIDPKRVACMGSSAGAGISMWIGFHDDLADPKSDDPVKRESTRIQAIGTFGGQGTYDPIQIKELIGGRAWEHPSIFKVYGTTTAEEALHPTPDRKKLYDEASAITHLTKDDPPLYMVYNEADGPLPAGARPGQGIHHPNFGKQLKKKMDELDIENVYVYAPDAKGRNPAAEMLAFFQKQFAAVR
jgi:acetyl esterase